MKVVPSGTLLALLDLAIEFVGELAESPTWRASCRCLPPSLLRDTVEKKTPPNSKKEEGTEPELNSRE